MKLRRRSIQTLITTILIALTLGQMPGSANTAATRPAPESESIFDAYIQPIVDWWYQEDGEPASRLTSGTAAEIFLCPTALTMYEGEDRLLNPVPVDEKGVTLHGVAFTWTSTNSAVAAVQDANRLVALAAGQTTITVWADEAFVDVSVTVLAGPRPENAPETYETCDKDLPEVEPPPPGVECNIAPEGVFPPVDGGVDPDISIGAGIVSYANAIGTPRNLPLEIGTGGMTPTPNKHALGSSNYQFTAQVAGLGGREIGVDLALSYNGQLWTNDNGQVHFDHDKGWPAAGWRVGYGRIVADYDGPNTNHHLLLTPNGTRVILLPDSTSPAQWTHLASDGSNIRMKKVSSSQMRVLYPNGTEMRFTNGSETNNKWLPTEIKTSNGNFLAITYRAYNSTNFPSKWAIATITDTLGRIYRFGYKSHSINGGGCILQLHYIKGPAPDGGEKILVLLDYDKITIHPNFNSPLTIATPNLPNNADSSLLVVRRIAYPLTGRGYVFSNFGTYGMAKTISVRRGMVSGVTGSGFPEVTDGVEMASTTYAYNDFGSLDDIPRYTSRTEKVYDQNGANPQTHTYGYSRTIPPQAVTSMVTPPGSLNMATMLTTVDPATGYTDTVEYKDGATVLRKIEYEYSGAQVSSVKTTDQGLTTETRYTYGDYDRLTKVREYGFDGTLLRTTTTSYKDGSNYLDRNLLYLVKDTLVYNGGDTNGVLVAKTEFDYDNYTLTTYGTSSVKGYDSGFNTRVHRGNLTDIRLYPDPSDFNSSIPRTRNYDKFGNVVSADLSCCQKRTITFNGTLWYSSPVSVASGPVAGPTLTTSYLYTTAGAVDTITAPTGQTVSYTYDAAWRPLTEVMRRAGGASDDVKTTYTHGTAFSAGYSNDAQTLTSLSQYKESYADTSFTRTITSTADFDGAGRAVREGVARPSGGFDYVSRTFDGAHRLVAQSNPYVTSASQWTSYAYDKLSRPVQVTLPGADTVTSAYANSSSPSLRTVTSTDPVGRKQENGYDALGRLARVVEDPDGYGYVTSYTYDMLDNLTLADQGGQYRRYAYDGLSRLRYEQIPEQTPSPALFANGVYWTSRYDYNDFNQVTDHTDARGVVTHYDY